MKNFGWILMCVLMIVFCFVAYQIVDTEPVGAYEITEMTPEDIAEEMFWDDLENMALCTMAECGFVKNDECIRATCDVMINRVQDSRFPDTFYGVFSQPGQYATFRQYYSINPTDRVFTICREQLEYFWEHGETEHPGAFFFRTGHFHNFGTPLFQAGPHYFSGF